MAFMSVLMVLGFLAIIMAIILAIAVLMYVFTGIGLSKIAKKLGEENSWLAWIPVANSYLVGKLGCNVKTGIFLAVASPVSGIISGIMNIMIQNQPVDLLNNDVIAIAFWMVIIALSLLSIALSITMLVFYLIAVYHIYEKFSKEAVIMTVFTALSAGILSPVFLFAIRNHEVRKEYT